MHTTPAFQFHLFVAVVTLVDVVSSSIFKVYPPLIQHVILAKAQPTASS